jgi:hypothetical protein
MSAILHQSRVHVRSELSCPACATTDSPDANFCKKCGARLSEDAAVSLEPASLANPPIQSSTSETVMRLSARHSEISKTYYTQLRLDPLGRESAEEMLSALLGASPAPATQSPGASRERPAGDLQVGGRVRVQDSIEGLKRLIIERTQGTPFFMEETVQVLLDEGALMRNGTMHLTKPLAELKIPSIVQAILASRIDRLPSDEKELLQNLAVIGREFTLSLVRLVLARRADDDLEQMLADLQLAEFIYEQPATGRHRVYLQARIDAGGRPQLGIDGAVPTTTRARGTSPGVDVRPAVGRPSERAGVSLRPQR